MNKKTLLTFLLLLAIAILVYTYTFKNHRDINSEKANYLITISGLEEEFNSNDSLAYTKYQDQTVELTAKITAVDQESNGIVLGHKVFATFKDSLPPEIVLGKTLKIKGRFLGYDELLEEFKIDQSSIIQ